jgi:ankyrin repeat protein
MSKYARFPSGQTSMASHGGSPGDTDPRDPSLGPTEYHGDAARFPLHAAAWLGDEGALRARLNCTKSGSMDLDAFDCSGNTPLDWAAARLPESPIQPRDGCVRLLLERGASLAAASSDGWTPLHYAAQWGDWPVVVELLLGAGEELMAKTSHGETAHDVAVRTGFLKTAALLARAEASKPTAEEQRRLVHDDAAITPGLVIDIGGRGRVGICGFASCLVHGNVHTVCVTTHEQVTCDADTLGSGAGASSSSNSTASSASSSSGSWCGSRVAGGGQWGIRREFVDLKLGVERWSLA